MKKTTILLGRLKDSRSRKVIFLSHCILNENTRYLGGACRDSCVREVVEQCLDSDWGIVQMPCLEQHTWDGVTKRWLLMTYGIKGTFLCQMRGPLIPLFVLYTRLHCRRLVKAIADQVNNYLGSGYAVIGKIGVDGSPSCGVNTTLDFERSFELTASMDINSITVEQMDMIIRQSLTDDRGLFTAALQDELKKQRIDIPYRAHDLMAELDGKKSNVGALLVS